MLQGNKLLLQGCRGPSKPLSYDVPADDPSKERNACTVLDNSYSLPRQYLYLQQEQPTFSYYLNQVNLTFCLGFARRSCHPRFFYSVAKQDILHKERACHVLTMAARLLLPRSLLLSLHHWYQHHHHHLLSSKPS